MSRGQFKKHAAYRKLKANLGALLVSDPKSGDICQDIIKICSYSALVYQGDRTIPQANWHSIWDQDECFTLTSSVSILCKPVGVLLHNLSLRRWGSTYLFSSLAG